MAEIKKFLTSKRGITFLALFVTLLLGITIGQHARGKAFP